MSVTVQLCLRLLSLAIATKSATTLENNYLQNNEEALCISVKWINIRCKDFSLTREQVMNLYNIKHPEQQVSFSQAVRQGLGKDQGLFFSEKLHSN